MESQYSLPVLRPGLSKAKYDQILRGARQVFLESGYGSASMDRIAREAGVSKGTLYNYFANKETLFATMIQGRKLISDERDEPVSEQFIRSAEEGSSAKETIRHLNDRLKELLKRKKD